jgi:hypothetical protein
MKRLSPLLFVFLACACDPPRIIPCDQIPEGGCPLDRGGSCDDPSCAAIYGCYDGAWRREEVCEGNTGGGTNTGSSMNAGGAGGGTGVGGPGGGAGCNPIEFDHSMDTTGCAPDLQEPDCPAAVAEECPEKACTTGCLDFYLCTTDGWKSAAYCDEDGNFFLAPD